MRRRNFLGRLSAMRDDPGYDNWARIFSDYKIRTFLDDVEQHEVDITDSNEGWISRLRMSRGGPLVWGGKFQTEVIKGNVEIRLEKLT
jgi:hypothetical protein